MRVIKIRNGTIRLEKPIFGENLSVGVLGLVLSLDLNLINIETDCSLKVEEKIIEIKTGKYTIEELNNIVKPLLISVEGEKIKIKSNVFFKLDVGLTKYLGLNNEQDKFFDRMSDRVAGDFPLQFTLPNPTDELIQINEKCSFIIGRNGHITPYDLCIGLYSLKELEKKFNIYTDSEHELNTTLTLEKGLLKITSPFNIGLDPYLFVCLGFEYKKKRENEDYYYFDNRGKTYSIFNYVWPTEKDVAEGKIFLDIIGVRSPNLCSESYLSNIEGNMYLDDGLIKKIPRKNYTINQLKSILEMDINVSDNELIVVKSNVNEFMFDNKLCNSLGVKFVNFSKVGIYPMGTSSNIPLELHCNITEESLSNHRENKQIHCEKNLLFIFNNPQDNLLLKPTNTTYVPVSAKKIQNIKIDILDLEGNLYDKFTEFIVYLSLIGS